MNSKEAIEGWEIMRQWLPQDLNERAKQHGLVRRPIGLQDAECWLRLILLHVVGGLSLEQTAVRAKELGWASLSAVALHKRLVQAQAYLEDLTRYLLAEQQRQLGGLEQPFGCRLRIVDGTSILEPGRTGTYWRLHYSIRLPELVCDQYELTDYYQGEKAQRFSFQPGELVLIDRCYSNGHSVGHVLVAGAQVVVRWNPNSFPLENRHGRPFKPVTRLQSLAEGQKGEWPVQFRYDCVIYRLRLCAMRKSQAEAQAAQQRVLEQAAQQGKLADPATVQLSAYILVLTSVDATVLTAEEALDLYRGRWQIELVFKRLKSLLTGGHVPKSNDGSAKAWMQAKLLAALLLERILLEGRFFSPN